MSRHLSIFLCLALVAPCFAERPEIKDPRRPDQSQAPRAWLGISVTKPDPTIGAHLPTLPPGIGFVVKSVDPGGPGEIAGIQDQDIVWKFRDQLLVNQSQLAALLRLAKPGDEVDLEGFRAGKPIQWKLKLGDSPQITQGTPGEIAEAAIFPGSNGPIRMVNVAEKQTSLTNDKGKAVVRREGEIYKVVIRAKDDRLIYEGDLPVEISRGGLPDKSFQDAVEKIPENWRSAVSALRRGLDQALEGGMNPVRQPRPRVVPPPAPVE